MKKLIQGFEFNPIQIAVIYFVVSSLWIFYSDRILHTLIDEQDVIAQIQTYKGIFFVIISTLIVYTLIKIHSKKTANAYRIAKTNEQRYRTLLNNSPFMVGLVQGYEIVYVNPEASKILEYTSDELIGEKITKVLHPSMHNKIMERMKAISEGTISDPSSTRQIYISGTGKEIPVEVYSVACRHGSFQGLQIIAIDISHRITREEKLEMMLQEKEVLISEIHHRVKNNLAIITALIQLQVMDSNLKEQSIFSDINRRIGAIAAIHEHIYQTNSFLEVRLDNKISDLINPIQQELEARNIDLMLDTEETYININQAVPCGLFINEVGSFAFKYIFNENEDHQELKLQLRSDQDKVTISYLFHTNSPFNEKIYKNMDGFNYELIEVIAKQLNGTLEFLSDPNPEVKLTFEIDHTLKGTTSNLNYS